MHLEHSLLHLCLVTDVRLNNFITTTICHHNSSIASRIHQNNLTNSQEATSNHNESNALPFRRQAPHHRTLRSLPGLLDRTGHLLPRSLLWPQHLVVSDLLPDIFHHRLGPGPCDETAEGEESVSDIRLDLYLPAQGRNCCDRLSRRHGVYGALGVVYALGLWVL